MKKVFKHIAIFSLWLAGVVIIAHLLIPHDHHMDCSVFSKDNECHAESTGHPVKLPVFPFHCHALNDLTVEKTTSIVAWLNVPDFDLFLLSYVGPAISTSVLSEILVRDIPKPPIETNFLRLSPFRAPPSLS